MKFNKIKCKVLHLAWAIPKISADWEMNVFRATLKRRTWRY